MIEPIVKRCAGLDVYKMVVVVTVLIEQADGSLYQEACEFGTLRPDRQKLCSWLQHHEVELVVMESTGNYWKSIHAALAAAQLCTYVVNAQHVKQVPGRKTDVTDSQWLAALARCGLLKPSFVAPVDFQQLRLISRHRMKKACWRRRRIGYTRYLTMRVYGLGAWSAIFTAPRRRR